MLKIMVGHYGEHIRDVDIITKGWIAPKDD
jgi:hypothetical protein